MDREAMRYVYGDLDPASTSVNEVHRIISAAAADIANQDPRKDPRFSFQAAAEQSEVTQEGTHGLTIEWDPGQYHLSYPLEERERVSRIMTEVGTDAIRQAIHVNQELFVGVIVGEARQGRDYFENFNG